MRNVGIEAERPNLPKPDAVVSAAEVVGHDADVDAAVDALPGVSVELAHGPAVAGVASRLDVLDARYYE